MDNSGAGSSIRKEHMFDLILTPDDISGNLQIPEEHVNHFPSMELLFSFIDATYKTWWFSSGRFMGRFLFLYDGWNQFVREKKLKVGDKVSFSRATRDENSKDVFYIDYDEEVRLAPETNSGILKMESSGEPRKRIHESGELLPHCDTGERAITRKTAIAHQLFDEMPQRGEGDCFSESNASLVSVTDTLMPVHQALTEELELEWELEFVLRTKERTDHMDLKSMASSSGFCKTHSQSQRKGDYASESKSSLSSVTEITTVQQALKADDLQLWHSVEQNPDDMVDKQKPRAIAPDSSSDCEVHRVGKRCIQPGCTKTAKGTTPFCTAHGCGKRCAFPGCMKAACSWNGFCIAHGSAKRCAFPGCTKARRGTSDFCTRHGGGSRCNFENCDKSAQGSTGFCKAHGGGKRCAFPGCTKFSRGKSNLCVGHYQRSSDDHSSESKSALSSVITSYPAISDLIYPVTLAPSSSSGFQLEAKLLATEMMVFGQPKGEINLQHPALLYCTLFPGDYEFEKDTLVQLWIAGGLFKEEPLESVTNWYFDNFLDLGYIQFSRTNLPTGKALYKCNENSLSDLLSIAREHHAVIDSNSSFTDPSSEISHVSVKCSSQMDSTALGGFKRLKQLNTLLFLQGHKSSFKQVPRDLFLSMDHLQALDLSRTHISELPSSIGNMKSLRYLDLSQTLIRRLPETIDRLTNLQALKLKGCSNLSTLPKGTSKLVDLHHLDLDVLRQLRSMPHGIGTLTNLQTLSAFLVGIEDECSIEQLKNMNKLTGNFCISRLENVLTEKEAMEACLSSKSQLRKLELRWSDSRDENIASELEVISSLKPNARLEELCISCFRGSELPSWIYNPAFSNLVAITLFKCENCLVLPSFGQLPSLKVLNIIEFHNLKVIDHNFYGGFGIQGYIAFPKLEKLTIENMLSLEEWTGIGYSVFPSLVKLVVKYCPKLYNLSTLSCLSSLENLEISHCEMLASCAESKLPALVETFIVEKCPLISAMFLNDRGQDLIKAGHFPNVWVDHQEITFG